MPRKTDGDKAGKPERVQRDRVPRKSFHLEFKNPAQKVAWAAFEQHDVLFLLGPAGTGKAQPLDARVYTPNGYKLMGDVQVGDAVCGPDGNSAFVVGVFPQGEKEILRITFSDGSSTECCREHLWRVSSISNGWRDKVVTADWLTNNYRSKSGRCHLFIPTTSPVHFVKQQEFIIPPYMMGQIIAEANLTSANLTLTTKDEEVVETLAGMTAEDYCWKRGSDRISHRLVKKHRSAAANKYKDQLHLLGLWGCLAHENHVPECYLYGTVQDRVALLQGLMDGDGTVNKCSGMASYSTSSYQLVQDFTHLVNSLGGTVSVSVKEKPFYYNKNNERIFGRVNYVCTPRLPNSIVPFTLSRKLRLYRPRVKYFAKRYIKNIEVIGVKPAQCIALDSADHLYLTDHFIVTHNTHLAIAFAVNEVLARRKKRIILTRPIVEAGESLGFLPGTFDEKVNPYMLPLFDCLGKLCGWDGPQREAVDRCIEVAPLAYMRGRSQPVDAKVLTPNGYIAMGEIQIGDKVVGRDGQPTEVLGVYPQGELDVYRVHFSDGTSVECSDDHLWSTMNLNEKRHEKGYSVKTTKEIRETLKTKSNQKFHQIPVSEPVNFSRSKPLPFDPYLMGVLLGEGNFDKKASVTITNTDQEVIDSVNRGLPEGLRLVLSEARSGFAAQYRVVGKKNGRNAVRSYLAECGLIGCKAPEKFIPDEFLYSEIGYRAALLQGLMDTDGSVFSHRSGNSRVQYYSTSKKLAEGVRFLVHSMGGTASIRKREYSDDDTHEYKGRAIRHCVPSYVVDIVLGEINPFRMSRKKDQFTYNKPRRLISKVEHVGKKECQCIRVSAADSLYLTEHCIVTHNTFDDAICIFDEAQNASMIQLKLFLTRFGENSKIIVTGDPSQSDLPCKTVALSEVVNKLESVEGIGIVQFKQNSICRHPLVGKIIQKLGGEDVQ